MLATRLHSLILALFSAIVDFLCIAIEETMWTVYVVARALGKGNK